MDIAYPDQNTASVTISIDVTDYIAKLAAQVAATVITQDQAALALDNFVAQKCVDAIRDYQTNRNSDKAAKVAALNAEIARVQAIPEIVTQATALTSAMAVSVNAVPKGP